MNIINLGRCYILKTYNSNYYSNSDCRSIMVDIYYVGQLPFFSSYNNNNVVIAAKNELHTYFINSIYYSQL